MRWEGNAQDGGCYCAAPFSSLETEAPGWGRGDGLQLHSMGQVGAQACGLGAKPTPTPNSPHPSTPSSRHPLVLLASARAELRGAGLGPRGGLLPGA